MSALKPVPYSDGSLKILFINNDKLLFSVRQYKSGDFEINSTPILVQQFNSDSYSTQNYSWKEILDIFKRWVTIVKDELEMPNLWDDLKKSVHAFNSIEEAPSEKFDDNEIRELQSKLRSLASKIHQSSLPQPAKMALLEIANSAPEKAERFTKKEWQGWFLGAVITQITTLALSQEHATSIYQMLKTTFTALLLH